MTGFGEAHAQLPDRAVSVEVRTINGRYFKLMLKTGEGYSSLEPLIEGVARTYVKRGNVQIQLRVDRVSSPDDFQINQEVLRGYRDQLVALCRRLHIEDQPRLEALLALPGVVTDRSGVQRDTAEDWPLVQPTLEAALANLTKMRREEGAALAADLAANVKEIGINLDRIAQRAPVVAENYRDRLVERVNRALGTLDATVEPADLLREISLFGERSDISEEIVRLRSHVDQFNAYLAEEESSGRKLEFLTQEMFREINTIGSKSNDVQIARDVINVKAAIERVREQIQNVE